MIHITDNRSLAMAMYAQSQCEHGLESPPTTAGELEASWTECDDQQRWLDRATMVRTFFRVSQRRGDR